MGNVCFQVLNHYFKMTSSVIHGQHSEATAGDRIRYPVIVTKLISLYRFDLEAWE